jgi:hypothetical protein
MLKGIIAFFLLAAAFYFGIGAFRKFTKREKLDTFKLVAYSGLSSLAALSVLVSIVVIF